ncbi:MAG: sigma-70 family RNA polymerase sigma factor [Gemmatimonadetes bacterium]|nr:sigma-70 family RNA polymerase sigma factor [Gemmatimonadota bacterium]NNJ47296.1 sigma-70 family RNA polymerase sigma factor [Acidimicrobiia bacterium]
MSTAPVESAAEARTDEELVERIRSSDRSDLREFEELMNRHAPRVMTNCRHLTGSSTDAEDLTQEVFVKVFFRLDRFEGRGAFGAWIQRIKVNHCLNHLKKQKRRRDVGLDDPSVATAEQLHTPARADAALESWDDRAVIGEVLGLMGDTLRIPLVMCDVDGFAYQEIADHLGVGLSAVKMRIKRGREEFRRLYLDLTGREA